MVDVSNIASGTEAKLYFDLLGGDRNFLVILDNVRLLRGNAIVNVEVQAEVSGGTRAVFRAIATRCQNLFACTGAF